MEMYFTAQDVNNYSAVCHVRSVTDNKYEIKQIVTLPHKEIAFNIIHVPSEKKLFYFTMKEPGNLDIGYLHEKSTEDVDSKPKIVLYLNKTVVHLTSYDYIKHKFYINFTPGDDKKCSLFYYFDTKNSETPYKLNYLRTFVERLVEMAIFSPKQGQLYARYRDCDAKGHCDGIQRNFGILMIDTREPTRSKDLVRTGTLNTYSMSALAVNEHNYRIYWSKTNDTDRQTELMSSTLDGSDIKKEFNIDFPYYMMISNNRLYMNTRFYGTGEAYNKRCAINTRLWRVCLEKNDCEDTYFELHAGNNVCIEYFDVVENVAIRSAYGWWVLFYCFIGFAFLVVLGFVAYKIRKYYERRRNGPDEEVVHFHRHFQPPPPIVHDSLAVTTITSVTTSVIS
ncbi:hypothetical protein TKK_0001308 [Trichogramma kaykai]